jgi:hypothetical protein
MTSILRSRAAVELENLALHHQIGVLQRSAAKRPKLTSGDRLFWICLSRLWCDWRSTLAIVKPETVVAWHRAAFRRFWTRKARRGLPRRPLISCEARDLIRKMCGRIPFGAHRGSMANCSNSASTSRKAALANTWSGETTRPLRLGALSSRITRVNWSPLISSRCPRSASRFFIFSWFWPMTAVAFCTSTLLPTRLRSGPEYNCERHFPLPNSRVTCCATAMRFSATTSENRCEIWASAKSCRHRARLGSEPM